MGCSARTVEYSNIGSKVGGTVAGAAQDLTGATTITTFSTTQIWGGNNPLKFNLVLDFFAWDNAAEQVMRPLQWLQEFASPQVNGWSPIDLKAAAKNLTGGDGGNAMGRMPMRVTLNVGRKIIIPECVIESVSVPIDGEKDSEGNLIRAQVTLDIQTLVMLNRDAVGAIYAQNMDAGHATFAKSTSESWEKKKEK